MIIVKLRQAIRAYRRKYGRTITYAGLSEATARLSPARTISKSTLGAIESRDGYNTSLKNIDTLCVILDTTPERLLEYVAEEPPLVHPLDFEPPTATRRRAGRGAAGGKKKAKKKRAKGNAPAGRTKKR